MKLNKRTSFVFALAALAVVGIIAVQVAGANADSVFSTNENGQTIGSAGDAASLDSEPELIAACATNGLEGYVYADDLNEAEGGNVSTPEEALAYMEERYSRIADALAEELNASTDGIVASSDVLLTLIESGAMDELTTSLYDSSSLSAESREVIDSAVSTLGLTITDEEFVSVYEAARKEAAVSIPVYAEDGVTVIGEFLVG